MKISVFFIIQCNCVNFRNVIFITNNASIAPNVNTVSKSLMDYDIDTTVRRILRRSRLTEDRGRRKTKSVTSYDVETSVRRRRRNNRRRSMKRNNGYEN